MNEAAAETPFATHSPIDLSDLEPVAATPVEDVAGLAKKARAAQRGWAKLSPRDRADKLLPLKDRILDAAERIANLAHKEVGKPIEEALLGEVLPSADVVAYWTASIEELLESVEVDLDPLAYPGKVGVIHKEARGVVGVIMPWNYPVALPLRSIVPALLAGNAVLFKPSEISPRCGALIDELMAGLLPDNVFSVVQGGGDVGGALCSAEDVDLIVFTGSVRTGRKVAAACAERLIPCALELGGKDAALVLADADLDRAANGIVWGALTNAGQNCAAIERVYVVKEVAEAFTKKVVEAVKGLKEGDVGPLTTEAQRTIVSEHVDAAKEAGAKVLCGGEKLKEGYGYAPTVLSVDTDDLAVIRDETFGPVLPIRIVADTAEAIERANDSRYGLTASIWTKNLAKGEELAHELRAGVVTINNHAFTGALPGAPWSGFGETGYGITNSPFALEGLTRPRFILVDRSRGAREVWWYPYTPILRTIALAFAKLRSGSTGIGGKISALFTLIGALPKRMKGK
ncbi:MAG TPA: aldehyde dehydrogenase family protein [Polyangiaceae bacterium]